MIEPPYCSNLNCREIQDYQSLKEKYESQGHLDGLKIIKQFDKIDLNFSP